jgi:hypothetical protein
MEKHIAPPGSTLEDDSQAECIAEVSRKVREESMRVNVEFAAIESDTED